MAGSINKVILVGNVGNDPEIRTSEKGKEIATFSIATNESWKDKTTGERKEKTEWHRVVVFTEGLVHIVKRYVKKGSKLYVEGQLQTRKWNDNENRERYTTEVMLQNFNSNVQLLDSRSSMEGGGGMSRHSNNSESSFDEKNLDDEVPF